jgi:hypothetical protein
MNSFLTIFIIFKVQIMRLQQGKAEIVPSSLPVIPPSAYIEDMKALYR